MTDDTIRRLREAAEMGTVTQPDAWVSVVLLADAERIVRESAPAVTDERERRYAAMVAAQGGPLMDETRFTVQGADGAAYEWGLCADGKWCDGVLDECPPREAALIAAYQAQARRIEELEAERDALKGQGYVAEAAVESEHEAYADLKAETARLRKALRDIEGIAWGKDTMISGLRKRIAAIAAAEAPKEPKA